MHSLSRILETLQPLIEDDFFISFDREMKNIVLLYRNADIELKAFKKTFKHFARILSQRLKECIIQKIEGRNILVYLKMKLKKNGKFKLPKNFFNFPNQIPSYEMYKAEDPELETILKEFEDRVGGAQTIKKIDLLDEGKISKKRKENLDFYNEYKKTRSVAHLVKKGLIPTSQFNKFQKIFALLEKDEAEAEEKLRKKIKREEN